MEQRRTPATATTANRSNPAHTLPEATDTDGSTLHDLLNLSEITWDELCRIGGLFRVHPATLIAGAS